MISISKTLSLPDDAVTQTFAFLARRGAGKTFGAMKLAEGMLDIKAQIMVLDPVGVWWGLRVGPDGKKPAYSLPIFGGHHGDLPLQANAGPLIAKLLVERGISAVLDVSMLRKNQRKQFAIEFGEELYHLKKANRSPIHLFIEEAQTFVPQNASEKGGERDPKGGFFSQQRMLGAYEDLVKLGRNFGIGVTLISQRPQSVNKDALNQTEALFVLQTNGAQERKSLEAWIVEQGINNKALVDDLPSLPVGTAYLWSPSWLRKLEKIQIGSRKTYNASATPTISSQQTIDVQPLSAQEMDAIKASMLASLETVKANDPVALKAKIAELNGRIAELSKTQKTVEVRVVDQAAVNKLQAVSAAVTQTLSQISNLVQDIQTIEKNLASALELESSPALKVTPIRTPIPIAQTLPSQTPLLPATTTVYPDTSLTKSERNVLGQLANYPQGLNKSQLAIMCGYTLTSGSFAATLTRLRAANYISGSPMQITPEGRIAVGPVQALPKGTELLNHWMSRLAKADGKILKLLVESYPHQLTKQEIADQCSYTLTSGSYAAALTRLRSLQLITGSGKGMQASSAFITEP